MRVIVIAPREIHNSLYKFYRKDNPFKDVKFFTLESFKKEANYQNSDEAIIYLIKNHQLSYDLANEYLTYLKRIKINQSNNEKIAKLIALRDELIANNLLFKNEYFDYELSNAKIEIYFASKLDKELIDIIKDKNYEFKETNNLTYPTVKSFSTSENELNYVFNKIAELISKGVNPNDIYLYGLSDDDKLIFERIKDNYHLNFNNAYRKTYLDKNYVIHFISQVSEVGVDKALEEIDNSDEIFKHNVIKYRLENISNLKQANIYKNIFKKIYLDNEKYASAINVISKPVVKENSYLFIVNFIQGKFPSIVRDNSYLNNIEKAEIGLNTSEIQNAVNLDIFSEYLRQNANIFVSYSLLSYSQKHYASPLIKLLKLKVDDNNETTQYYSLNEARIKYASLEDLKRNYLDKNPLLKSFRKSDIKIPYRTYDYRYKPVKHFIDEETIKLSYSQVKTYCQCGYRYYLSNVLEVDEVDTSFNLAIGSLGHHIFERINEQKSFDEIYEEELSKIKDLGKYDWVYLRRIKKEIKKTFDFIKEFENQIDNPYIYREKKFDESKDGIKLDENTYLTGIIDKLIEFGENNFAIVDYKLGSEEFKEDQVKYGLSLQLPTYALISSIANAFKGKTLAGLFIQRFVVSSAITSQVDTENEEKSLLKGVFLNNIDVINKLDSNLNDGTSKFIASCKLKKDGGFTNVSKAKDEEFFTNLADEAKKHIINSAHSILNNDFRINPKIVNGKNASCIYCPYRDICYRDEKSFVILTNGTGEEDGTN